MLPLKRGPQAFSSISVLVLTITMLVYSLNHQATCQESPNVDPSSGNPEPGPPIGTAPGWQLVYSDEFNGNALDTSKWIPSMEDGLKFFQGKDVSAYEPQNILFRNGNIILQGLHVPGDGMEWTSGAITTRQTFRYGYFETRMKLPKSIGVWPAWWFGWPKDGSQWKEYDIVESRGNTTVISQTGANYCGDYHGIDPADGFHVYGFLWTPSDVYFYIDGKETCNTPNVDNGGPMPIMFDNLVGGAAACPPNWNPCPDDKTFPADMLIDYFRVWQQHGIASIPGSSR